MSSETSLRVSHVSKGYQVRSGKAGLRSLLGRRPAEHRDALHDISFEIGRGEATALLGTNGAGKSTLLRLLAGISRPSSGTIEVDGRVGALIEVWSGVHPELTGRENISTYGRILGLSKREVANQFDAIVAFAELGHVLDQQVKYYSSGMQLRLGFSIAAHIEPEVLLIDEALAVGDARFQRRCLTRIRQLMRNGTTLLYVSHDLKSVEALCDRALLLNQGRLDADGACRDVLARYMEQSTDALATLGRLDQSANLVVLESVTLFDSGGRPTTELAGGSSAGVELCFSGPGPLVRPQVAVGISQGGSMPLAVFSMAEHGCAPPQVGSRWLCRLAIDELPLRTGSYELWVGVLGEDSLSDLFEWSHVLSFGIRHAPGLGGRGITEIGPLALAHRFVVDPALT